MENIMQTAGIIGIIYGLYRVIQGYIGIIVDLDYTVWPNDAALSKFTEPFTTTESTARNGELRTSRGIRLRISGIEFGV